MKQKAPKVLLIVLVVAILGTTIITINNLSTIMMITAAKRNANAGTEVIYRQVDANGNAVNNGGSQNSGTPVNNNAQNNTPANNNSGNNNTPANNKTQQQQQTYPVIIPDKELINGIQPVDINEFDPDPSNWTTQQIVDYYKFGMAMEDNADVMTDQSFELIGSLDGKASILNGPVKLAMKLAAQPYNALTGGYWDLQPSDLKSADAHREGDYIVINLYPLEQTDGPNGNEHEGTVGHVVNVVQGIDGFIAYVEENFSILNAKYDDDSVVLQYSNAYAKDVKINTKTGKMESGTWGYDVDIYLDHCSMAGIEFENFHTAMRWKCWYPVVD